MDWMGLMMNYNIIALFLVDFVMITKDNLLYFFLHKTLKESGKRYPKSQDGFHHKLV